MRRSSVTAAEQCGNREARQPSNVAVERRGRLASQRRRGQPMLERVAGSQGNSAGRHNSNRAPRTWLPTAVPDRYETTPPYRLRTPLMGLTLRRYANGS